MSKLPTDFFFGAAMSGPQTEGAWRRFGKVDNLWDTWSNERIEDFHNRVGSYADADVHSDMEKVATITEEQVKQIAEQKMADLNAASIEAAMSMVKGTARSMGVVVSE